MSCTRSVKKGQVAMACQLCDLEQRVRWKCIDCDLFICNLCQNIHCRVRSEKEHLIVDIKEAYKYDNFYQKQNCIKIKCKTHFEQQCCLFCKMCQVTVCPTCIADSHKSHEFVELTEGLHICRNRVIKGQKYIEQGIINLNVGEQKLQKLKQNEMSRFETEKAKILEHNHVLMQRLEDHTSKLLCNLDERKTILMKSIDFEKKVVLEHRTKLLQYKEEIDMTVKSNDSRSIFNEADSVGQKQQNMRLVNTSFKLLPRFHSHELPDYNLVFGSLEYVPQQTQSDIQFQNVKHITINLPRIDEMMICADDSVWMSNWNEKRLRKIMPNEELVSNEVNINIQVYDMALTPHGDLLLSTKEGSLKLIPKGKSKVKDSCYKVVPYITTAIHVTKDYKVLVGAMSKEKYFFGSLDFVQQVIVMDDKGTPIQSYEDMFRPKSNTTLTLVSMSSTSSCSRKIGVLCRENEKGTGKIVILNEKPQDSTAGHTLKSGKNDVVEYSGKDGQPFKPQSIEVTESDNFIICDTENQTLHVINCRGDMIICTETKSIGIEMPWSLCINDIGVLYIGTASYKKKTDAKLHMVQVFGC